MSLQKNEDTTMKNGVYFAVCTEMLERKMAGEISHETAIRSVGGWCEIFIGQRLR
jgi:hypothetical protein